MKRNNGQIPTIVFVMITAVALLGSGCAKKPFSEGWPVRYQVVKVPGYEPQDYLVQMETDDEAVRCNAICNLIPLAGGYGEQLSPATEAPETSQPAVDETNLKSARLVYAHIKAQIGSPDGGCQAAALIFLSEFAAGYADKQEVIRLALSVKTKDPRIQYEQLHVLESVHDAPHALDSVAPGALKPFLDSSDWIVRAMTYRLLSHIPCDELHPRLVQTYLHSPLETDKILIAHAFGQGYGGLVFDLLRRELQENRHQRLKAQWAGLLLAHRDQAAARRWLFAGDGAIDEATTKDILDAYYGVLNAPAGQRFFQELILSRQSRWSDALDPERFYRSFYNALACGEKTNALTDLQAAVMSDESLQKQWLIYRDRYDREEQTQAARKKRDEQFSQRILPKFSLRLEKFLKESEQLFLHEGMDAREAAEATQGIRQMLELLQEEQPRK